jgi:hypothetical protein
MFHTSGPFYEIATFLFNHELQTELVIARYDKL